MKYHAAQAGTDYVGISKTITFLPEETSKIVSIVILDDVGSPVMEGLEQFEVYLRPDFKLMPALLLAKIAAFWDRHPIRGNKIQRPR